MINAAAAGSGAERRRSEPPRSPVAMDDDVGGYRGRSAGERSEDTIRTIFTTTETPTLPKAWSIWRSTSASPLPRIGSAQSINSTTQHLAAYPNTDAATKAIAEAHNVTVDQVLPTAGGAEAFTLLARAFRPERPLIIHPQFTEPEAALLAAGHRPQRLILSSATGFRLEPGPDARRKRIWS